MQNSWGNVGNFDCHIIYLRRRQRDIGIELIFKIAAIGIVTAIVNQMLNKAGKEELGLMASLAGIIIVVLMVVEKVSYLFNSVKALFDL